MNLTDALKECLREDPRSYADIAARVGVADSTLVRFVNGDRKINNETVDALMDEYIHQWPKKCGLKIDMRMRK